MSASKKRAAPRPPASAVSGPTKPSQSETPSNGNASVGDGFLDKTVELTVVLPDQSHEKIHIVPSTALFDLRTQLCGKYRLSYSAHKLEPVDDKGRAIPYTTSSTVESLEAAAVHLIPRMKDTAKVTPIKTVEPTVRLTVKTSHAHQQVVRVKPNVPLRTLLSNILDKTNNPKESHQYLQLRHPSRISESLDLSKSLDEYDKLREVFVVDTRDKQFKSSRDGSTKKKSKKLKKLFKFGRKKSKDQIVSPTSTSPPSSISEAPEFFNEQGVDTAALEAKRQSLKQSTSQQNETLHGQMSRKMQDPVNAQRSVDVSDGEESDEGKKKAPAPPAPPSQPSSPAEPVYARPEKPRRRRSIEKEKEANEKRDTDEEADIVDGKSEHVVGTRIDATATALTDDVSISSDEEVIAKSEEPEDSRLYQQDSEDELDESVNVIKPSEDDTGNNIKNAETPMEESIVTVSPNVEHEVEQAIVVNDDISSEEEEIREALKETSGFVKAQEPVDAYSSDDDDVTGKPTHDSETPQISDSASHHVITPNFGIDANDLVTEEDLQNLSDTEIPIVVSQDSESDEDELRRDTEREPAVETPPPILQEEERSVKPPTIHQQELPKPVVIDSRRTPSPTPVETVKEIIVDQPVANVHDVKLTSTPVVPMPPATQSQSAVVKEAFSGAKQGDVQPPPLNDEENLFTTPQDYDVYEKHEDNMEDMEAQAFAMLQKFQPTPAADERPPSPVIEEKPVIKTIETKPKPQTEHPQSVAKLAPPAQQAETVEEQSDKQAEEEIKRLQEQLRIAKEKIAQQEAEAEYAKKHPYTIVEGQNSNDTPQFGKSKTYTFVPNQRSQQRYEDYPTAPQPVIKLSQRGEIRGIAFDMVEREDKSTPKPVTDTQEMKKPPTTVSPTPAPAIIVAKPYSKPAASPAKVAAPTSSVTNYPPSKPENAKPNPSVASIMVESLRPLNQSGLKQENSSTNSQTPKSAAAQPKSTTPSATRGAGGYVNSAILKQPVASPSPASKALPQVYDWTSSKKSVLPSYYKRFLGVDAVTGTNKAVDKFKSNVGENKNVPNGNVVTPAVEKPKQSPVSPTSPTKPVVATKPAYFSSNSSAGQSSKPTVADSLNKALNSGSVTSLPLPPEERSNGAVNNQGFDGTVIPPPPQEFLSSPGDSIPMKSPSNYARPATTPPPTSPKSASLSPSYVGMASAKPFGSTASGGPKFRPMAATFKSGKTNKASP